MFERGLTRDDVAEVISNGEVIAEYPDDKPLPSVLILGYSEDQPIHVAIAIQAQTGNCLVITVYLPDSEKWEPDFRKRRFK
ncbi:MAG: DUF4258 domain-containing protein [Calditrichota bacterium]